MARLLFLIIGFKKPSSKKRVLDSIGYIKSKGHDAVVREIPHNLPGQLSLLKDVGRYDVTIIQKKLFNPVQFKLMRFFSRKLVFDLDDAVMFHELERNEPFTGKYFKRFIQTVRWCDCVITGNDYLAAFAKAVKGRDERPTVAVLPTPVDTGALKPKRYDRKGEGVTIGWIGTKGNLSSLELIREPLKKLMNSYPSLRVKIISSDATRIPGLSVDFKPWDAEDEAEDLRSLDIGVMPLEDDLWTRGKGGYKLLQYMAAGVPAVASPVGINSEIIKDEVNGFLASDGEQWLIKLGRLVEDPQLREEIGKAGRETVESDFSLGRYNERLALLLENLA